MLVLSRKRDEEIHLYLEGKLLASIRVVTFERGKVRLGFTAPQEVKIVRPELKPEEE